MLTAARSRAEAGPAARRLAASALGLLALVVLLAPADGGTATARGTASSAITAASETPTPGAVYKAGPSGRYLLGGRWLFRFDDGVGASERFQDSRSTSGWTAVAVPNAWNAGEQTAAGYAPTVGWYRKDFLLPSSSPQYTWIVRFESINNRVTIWLNGHQIGAHTGAFLAFEVVLPESDLNRSAVNRLVLRVSDAHTETDLPPLSRAGPHGDRRRLVELRRPAARGLPAPRRADRFRQRAGAAATRVRDLQRRDLLLGRRAQLRVERAARRAQHDLRCARREPRAAHDRRRLERHLRRAAARQPSAAVAAERAAPLPGEPRGAGRRRQARRRRSSRSRTTSSRAASARSA